MFDKLKLHYGIKKDFSKLRYKELEKRYLEYGSKEAYMESIRKKSEETKIELYGSIEEAEKQRRKNISETWNNKSDEEISSFISKMLANGGGWNYKKAS